MRQFENANIRKQSYCLFVAPSLHTDTVNTFYFAVKYEYEGTPQKINPITISQLEEILKTIKALTSKGEKFNHSKIQELYDLCTNMDNVSDSRQWIAHISDGLREWQSSLVL